ncbi:MAG: 30S ribosomal protein S11 [Opitutae bacterium]
MNEENESQTPEEDTEGNQAEASTENSPEESTAEQDSAEETAPAPEAKSDAGKSEAKPEANEDTSSDGSADGQDSESDEKEAPIKKEETAEDLLKSELAEVKIRRAKGSKNITNGIVNVTATFNNTKVNITDMRGNTISWSSSGKCNFRGSRKSTAYAAQVVTMDAGRAAMAHGLKEVVVKLCGPGMGRDSAVRALQSLGLTVTSIVDVTPVPHNGCRPPKRRRV